MSSPGQGGAGGSEDKPRGLVKFMRRASLVLKRDKSKRQSISGSSALAPIKDAPPASSPTTGASAPVAGVFETAPTLSVPAQITQAIKDNKPPPTPIKPRSAMSAKENSAIQEQKARAMFAKYGLTLEPGEWTVPYTDGAPRVEKKVRMRVHRKCHRCQTSFGADKICSNCQHTRCKKCPAFPSKTSKVSKGKGKATEGIAVDDDLAQGMGNLTMANRATGKELARKTPTQRVRRTCHQCGSLFVGKAIQCENCRHERCAACPRDPPKTNKYPEGYPGDRESTFPLGVREMKPIRTHVRWQCEKCDTTFKDKETLCGNCGHEKCDSCPRKPPKKVKRPLDEDAVRSVEERMKNMEVSPAA